MRMQRLRNREGFTLVELAIVLVIIGIILGAVLKGQTLIDNSRAKRVQSDIKGLEAMIWTYFDRNGRLPGDCDQDGIIEFNAPNNTTGTTPSNSANPNQDDCTGVGGGNPDANVNRVFSDLRIAQIAPYNQPNINLAKHKANGFFNVGMDTAGGTNYSAIFIYNIPAWMAKMIDVSIDGRESGTQGRFRRHDTQDGGANWPNQTQNNTLVAGAYYFDKSP